MAIILSIETSTSLCSLAVHQDGGLLALVEVNEPGIHAEKIVLLIEEAVEKSGKTFGDLDAVAVSEGPGSYTGLRIGVSTAKGFAFGLGIPLIGINTLQALASAVSLEFGERVIPVIDARRMEVYCQIFDERNKALSSIESKVLDENSFQDELSQRTVVFVGDAVEKVKLVISHSNAKFLDTPTFSAQNLGGLAYKKYQIQQFEDLAYFVPNYLKEFKALHSKKNPLLSI